MAFDESVQPSPWEKCVCMGMYGSALFVGKNMLAKMYISENRTVPPVQTKSRRFRDVVPECLV